MVQSIKPLTTEKKPHTIHMYHMGLGVLSMKKWVSFTLLLALLLSSMVGSSFADREPAPSPPPQDQVSGDSGTEEPVKAGPPNQNDDPSGEDAQKYARVAQSYSALRIMLAEQGRGEGYYPDHYGGAYLDANFNLVILIKDLYSFEASKDFYYSKLNLEHIIFVDAKTTYQELHETSMKVAFLDYSKIGAAHIMSGVQTAENNVLLALKAEQKDESIELIS